MRTKSLEWTKWFWLFLNSQPIPDLSVMYQPPQDGQAGFLFFSSHYFRRYLRHDEAGPSLDKERAGKYVNSARNFLRSNQIQTPQLYTAQVQEAAALSRGGSKKTVSLFTLPAEVWARLGPPSPVEDDLSRTGRSASPPPEDEQPSLKTRKNNHGERKTADLFSAAPTSSFQTSPGLMVAIQTRLTQAAVGIAAAAESAAALEVLLQGSTTSGSPALLEDLSKLKHLLSSASSLTARVVMHTVSSPPLVPLPASPITPLPAGFSRAAEDITTEEPEAALEETASDEPEQPEVGSHVVSEAVFFFCPSADMPDRASH